MRDVTPWELWTVAGRVMDKDASARAPWLLLVLLASSSSPSFGIAGVKRVQINHGCKLDTQRCIE